VPEQEKTRSKQESETQELSPAREQIGQAIAEGGGAQTINPMIIIPPVLITAVMSLLLAVVYDVTKEPIAEAKRLDKQQKLSAVMPTFANDPLELEQVLSDSVTLYTGTVEGGVNGYGITSSVKTGYSGYFSIVFGMQPDGTIERVRILESFETPGLGSKAGESPFIDQFDGKHHDSFDFRVVKDGGEIDAVTGATITSRAVCDALTAGLDAFGQADLSAFEPRDIEQEIE
jgi:electron transport complex protein RnfG